MTVICAKKTANKIILGADSQTTYGNNKLTSKGKEGDWSKVLKLSDEFAMAGAGKAAEISIFHRYCERTIPKGNTENDIYDFMVEFHDFVKKSDSTFKFCSKYIIAYKGRLFSVWNGFNIKSHREFCAGGSGMFCALTAFHFNKSVNEAVGAAIEFDLYCGGNIKTVELSI